MAEVTCVRERMRPGEAVAWYDSAEAAFARMRSAGIDAVPVIHETTVIGLVERSAARACQSSGNWLDSVPVATLMRRGLFACHTTDSLAEALTTMDQLETDLLAVVDEQGRFAGIIERTLALDPRPSGLSATTVC